MAVGKDVAWLRDNKALILEGKVPTDELVLWVVSGAHSCLAHKLMYDEAVTSNDKHLMEVFASHSGVVYAEMSNPEMLSVSALV